MRHYKYLCKCGVSEVRTELFHGDWYCGQCFYLNKYGPPMSMTEEFETREFETGATRGKDDDKLDYEGFLSPLVIEAFAKYMHKCRLRNVPVGQSVRSSDNWQKGMPLTSYMKSGWRHFMDWWKGHRLDSSLQSVTTDEQLEEALCALLFNVQGYLHELLKAKDGTRRITDTTQDRPVSGVPVGSGFDTQI